jgi:hypothetical protein
VRAQLQECQDGVQITHVHLSLVNDALQRQAWHVGAATLETSVLMVIFNFDGVTTLGR